MGRYSAEFLERERIADESAFRWAESHPDPERPAPTQPLSIRDGDLLLIGSSGAVDETGYRELVRRYGGRA